MNLGSERESESESGCSEKREKQIIHQLRIELKGERRREWLKNEKEIMKQHGGGEGDKAKMKSKAKKE